MILVGVNLLFTCEHGGNEIPAEYGKHFAGQETVLATHRGYDPGALCAARRLAEACSAPIFYSTTSRLLVELNRSAGNRRSLFSEYVSHLQAAEKQAVLAEFYFPYRNKVETAIAEKVDAGKTVLHVSVHSFTPVLNGQIRNADIGILYDPRRAREKSFAIAWATALAATNNRLRIKRNYPYLGKADGFTTYLRRCFPQENYLGIELEINQEFPLGDRQRWRELQEILVESFLSSESCLLADVVHK